MKSWHVGVILIAVVLVTVGAYALVERDNIRVVAERHAVDFPKFPTKDQVRIEWCDANQALTSKAIVVYSISNPEFHLNYVREKLADTTADTISVCCADGYPIIVLQVIGGKAVRAAGFYRGEGMQELYTALQAGYGKHFSDVFSPPSVEVLRHHPTAGNPSCALSRRS